MNEVMVANDVMSPVWTRITHALFEDSGWYKPNYELAKPIVWGRN